MGEHIIPIHVAYVDGSVDGVLLKWAQIMSQGCARGGIGIGVVRTGSDNVALFGQLNGNFSSSLAGHSRHEDFHEIPPGRWHLPRIASWADDPTTRVEGPIRPAAPPLLAL